jgi:hypothetical protein
MTEDKVIVSWADLYSQHANGSRTARTTAEANALVSRWFFRYGVDLFVKTEEEAFYGGCEGNDDDVWGDAEQGSRGPRGEGSEREREWEQWAWTDERWERR